MSRFLDLINGKPAPAEIPTPKEEKKVEIKKAPTYTPSKKDFK